MDKKSRRDQNEGDIYDDAPENDSIEGTDAPDTPDAAGSEVDAPQGGISGLRAMIQGNPKAVRMGAGVAVLLGLLVILLWFYVFSGPEEKARRPVPARGPAAPQEGPLRPDIGLEEDDEPDDDTQPEPGEADAAARPTPEAPPDEPPEVPPLPEDMTQWAPDDFHRARREAHPKLVDAIGHLGRNSVHNESVAAFLTEMLVPLDPEEPDESGEGSPPRSPGRIGHPRAARPADAAGHVDAVVDALALNDTVAARKTLEQILSGALVVAGDETQALEAALRAAAEHATPGNEELLFRVLTAPEEFRQPGAAPARPGPGAQGRPLSAEWLRARALAVVEKTASMRFRAQLGGFLVQPTTPLAWRAEMGEFLLAADPDNLGAQFVMYQSEGLDAPTRQRIEEHFAGRSAQAMQAVLALPQETGGAGRGGGARGVRPAARRTAMPPSEHDPELPFRLARQLWGERSTDVFAQRLAEMDQREASGHLLALGAAMPVESVRAAMLNALKALHAGGPDVLEKAGLPGAMVSDPGFVLVVKSLDRQEPQVPPAGRPQPRPTPGRPGARPQPRPTPARAADNAGRKWMQFSEKLVRSWCERLDAAALTNDENARLAGKNPEALRRLEDLPIELHEGADVRAAYHRVLPGALADSLSGARLGPMRIQYVRMEERATIKRMAGYYRRVARVRDGRPIDDGLWIDTYRPATAAGLRCSLDVFIRLPEHRGGRDVDPDAEHNMVIEVLSIEAREP